MFLLGFCRKLTALALCKSIGSAIQWFQIHHRIIFATIHNPAVYLSGARVNIFCYLGSPTIWKTESIRLCFVKRCMLKLCDDVVTFERLQMTSFCLENSSVRKGIV